MKGGEGERVGQRINSMTNLERSIKKRDGLVENGMNSKKTEEGSGNGNKKGPGNLEIERIEEIRPKKMK